MKISDLIKKLEEIKEIEGDIWVCAWPYDGQPDHFFVIEADIDVVCTEDGRRVVEIMSS